MLIATIVDYGYVHQNPDTGSVLDIDSLVYLLIRQSRWTDYKLQKWRIGHNPNEGFNVTCYDIGMDKYCKTIEELVETLKLLLEED